MVGVDDWTEPGCANDSRAMHPLATRKPPALRGTRRFRPNFGLRICAAIFAAFTPMLASALSIDVETTPSGDVFPALELSQSATDPATSERLGSGLLRVRVEGVRMPRSIRLTISTPGLVVPTVVDARLDRDTVLRPRLDWDVENLRSLVAPRTQILRVTLSADGMKTLTRELAIRVHPLDEALYFVHEGGARIDLGWAFAAWVDPQHPVVDELLAMAGIEAPAQHLPAPVRSERLRQVRALWTALEQRGLRYADEGAGISQGPVIYSQRVRLLSTTWNERVANCLDGSVLIASALERLGIGSFLVLVPGHAFVGFYTDEGRREAEFLETTLLGFRKPMQRSAQVESDEQIRQRALAGFEAARRAGKTRYRSVVPRLDGQHRPDYALVDISTARAYGIMPLAVGRGDIRAGAPLITSAPVSRRRSHSHSP